ncbi:hypothetical protein [Vibrio phage BONAISHI]|nr:hypothetical protein [Vibrio phage BONAISHI]
MKKYTKKPALKKITKAKYLRAVEYVGNDKKVDLDISGIWPSDVELDPNCPRPKCDLPYIQSGHVNQNYIYFERIDPVRSRAAPSSCVYNVTHWRIHIRKYQIGMLYQAIDLLEEICLETDNDLNP